MVYCCVPLCKSNQNKECDFSFHCFPQDEGLRKKWCVAISREGDKPRTLWTPNKKSRVCSRHFKEADFSISTTLKRLLPNVVPSVFDDFPKHKQNVSNISRRNKRRITEVVNNIHPAKKNKPNVEHSTSAFNEANVSIEEIYEAHKKTIATQCSIESKKIPKAITLQRKKITRTIRKQNQLIGKLRQTICNLKSKLWSLQKQNEKEEQGIEKQLTKIKEAAKEGSLKASFLTEQIQAFGKQKCKFHENTLKICILLSNRSSTGYRLLRNLGILHLPHQKTLKTYIGHSKGETGVTSLIKARLIAEEKSLEHENEKVGSLIIDEMSIKPKLMYDRNLDMLIGMTDTEKNAIGIENKLANKLLCILFKGLSTKYRIPVSFYFTHNLTGDELAKLTMEALKVVEDIGFKVIRIVTDNCQVNVAMFQHLCGKKGQLTHEIQHPVDDNRSLFLSFDASHIIKNVRSQHLDRNFEVNGNSISADYMKKLYHLQKKD